jgi:ankyrin repeat protein
MSWQGILLHGCMQQNEGFIDLALKYIDMHRIVNQTNGDEATVLMHTAALGHREVTEKLLAMGANREKKDEHGRSAWWYATEFGHDDIATLLDEQADVS